MMSKEKEESSLIRHAKRELELANWMDNEESMYGDLLPKAVLELLQCFADQGHSGMSAPLVSAVFQKLSMFDILTPLTGKDDEWAEIEPGKYQNLRQSAVFKDGKDGPARYIDGIIWKGEYGSFTGTVEGISSSIQIEFPCMPKKFYVEVEPVPGTDTERIKDHVELQNAFDYYKQPNPLKNG